MSKELREKIDTALHPERNGVLMKDVAEGASHEHVVVESLLSLIAKEKRELADKMIASVGEPEEAYLYGSTEQSKMNDDDKWENDLAIARNYLRSQIRAAMDKVREEIT